MIDLQSAIKQLQELAEEHHERASELSCVPFCYNDWAVEAGIAAAYDNAIEILTDKKTILIDADNLKTALVDMLQGGGH